MAAKKDFNIFEALKQANNKNYNWFSNLSQEEKDAFQPWLAMRFMSTSKQSPESSLLMTNYILNEHFSITSKDKDFFYRLMCAVGDGGFKSHSMISPPKKRQASPIISLIVKEIAGENLEDREIRIFLKNNDIDVDDLYEIAEDLGLEVSKKEEIQKSYDNLMNTQSN